LDKSSLITLNGIFFIALPCHREPSVKQNGNAVLELPCQLTKFEGRKLCRAIAPAWM
jgi:hypothetical protein